MLTIVRNIKIGLRLKPLFGPNNTDSVLPKCRDNLLHLNLWLNLSISELRTDSISDLLLPHIHIVNSFVLDDRLSNGHFDLLRVWMVTFVTKEISRILSPPHIFIWWILFWDIWVYYRQKWDNLSDLYIRSYNLTPFYNCIEHLSNLNSTFLRSLKW